MTTSRIHNAEQPRRLPNDLGLPGDVTLYLAGGVPQMFEQVAPAPSSSDRWLYLPFGLLRSLTEPVDQPEGEPVARTGDVVPVEDGQFLIPFRIGNRIAAVTTGPFQDKPTGDSWTNSLLDYLLHSEFMMTAGEREDTTRQLADLLEPYASVDRFIRNLLNKLIARLPDGLAAVYDESEGLYRLRTAVGNIAMWDVLEGALTLSQASRWLSAVRLGQHFLSAGFLPEHPTLLETPPTFVFVYPGLRSSRTSRLLAMPVTGDLSPEIARDLHTIAGLGAVLHEDQFGAVEDIHAMCGRLRSRPGRENSFDNLLTEIFELVSLRTRLSRMVYVQDNGRTSAVIHRMHARPSIRKEAPPCIAANIIEAAGSGRILVHDVAQPGFLTEDEAKRYYLDNVKAELCIRLSGQPGDCSCVAFGTAGDADVLRKHERMLEIVAMMLYYYRRMRGGDPTIAPRESVTGQLTASRRRFKAVAKLMEGHFHAAFESLSCIIGRSEIAASMPGKPAETPESYAEAIRNVAEQLELIRDIFRQASDGDAAHIGLREALTNLPKTFEGMTHLLQDMKNIAVRVKPGTRPEGSRRLPAEDIYDQLYPVLLGIMEEAICSGEITVSGGRAHGSEAIRIECPADMIAHTTLAAIIQAFNDCTGEMDPQRKCLVVDVARAHWLCDTDSESMQRAWLVFNLTPSHTPGKQPSERTSHRPEAG